MAGFTPSEKTKLLARVATLEAQMSGVAEFIEMMKASMRAQKKASPLEDTPPPKTKRASKG